MAEKDITEKVLLSHADVFADCVNALAYGGRARLRAEYMRRAPTESFLRGSKRMHNQFCDLEALTGDYRFTDLIGELQERQRRKEEVMMCEYIDMLEARGEARGKAIGEAHGEAIGENRLASLLSKLYALGRDEDAKLAVNDRQARVRLYEELCIG